MRKLMVGDVVVVVIDEIGEVTFCDHVMNDLVGVCSDLETAERTMQAVSEMMYIAWRILPACPAGYHLLKAWEAVQADFKPLCDRLSEQYEFSRTARKD